jgi:hypothetical protein
VWNSDGPHPHSLSPPPCPLRCGFAASGSATVSFGCSAKDAYAASRPPYGMSVIEFTPTIPVKRRGAAVPSEETSDNRARGELEN